MRTLQAYDDRREEPSTLATDKSSTSPMVGLGELLSPGSPGAGRRTLKFYDGCRVSSTSSIEVDGRVLDPLTCAKPS